MTRRRSRPSPRRLPDAGRSVRGPCRPMARERRRATRHGDRRRVQAVERWRSFSRPLQAPSPPGSEAEGGETIGSRRGRAGKVSALAGAPRPGGWRPGFSDRLEHRGRHGRPGSDHHRTAGRMPAVRKRASSPDQDVVKLPECFEEAICGRILEVIHHIEENFRFTEPNCLEHPNQIRVLFSIFSLALSVEIRLLGARKQPPPLKEAPFRPRSTLRLADRIGNPCRSERCYSPPA